MKKRVVVRGLMWLVVLVVIAAAVALVYLRHHAQYYNGEKLDEASLNAIAAEFAVVAQAMQDRPKQDREALEALIKQVVPADTDGKWILDEGCDDIAQKLETDKALIDTVRQHDQEYRNILDDGAVIQIDAEFDAELPNFIYYRALNQLQLEAAMQDALAGNSTAATDRLLLNRRISDGLMETPTYITNMIAVALESRTNQALVFMLPHLSSADVQRLKSAIESSPSAERALVESIKVESTTLLKVAEREPEMSDFVYKEYIGNAAVSRACGRLWNGLGFKRLERLRYLRMMSELVQEFNRWIDQGAQGTPEFANAMFEKLIEDKALMVASPMILVACPNYGSLMNKCSEIENKRAALIAALDAELQRRESGPAQSVTVPYGEDQQIVLGPEHGCIESIAK